MEWSNDILNRAIDLLVDTLATVRPELSASEQGLVDRVYDRLCARLRY